MQSEIKTDWTSKMSAHTGSGAYARQNGKPVVGIWGFGFNDNNHPWDAAACLDVINWFKGQGCYVMGGVPREWRTGTGGSRAGYSGVYHALNMLSPWMVGAISTMGDSDNAYTNLTVPDQADCNANGIDYQPCVLPGDVSARQRVHGDFMWRQFYNVVRAGCAGCLHLDVRRVQRGQPDRQDRRVAVLHAHQCRTARPERGRHRLLLRLLPAADRRRRPHAQGPARAHRRPAHPAHGRQHPAADDTASTTVISLRARANNMYVCADNAGASPLIANRAAAGPWETFDVLDAGGGNVALRAHANNQIVCADNAGAPPLIANRTAAGGLGDLPARPQRRRHREPAVARQQQLRHAPRTPARAR